MKEIINEMMDNINNLKKELNYLNKNVNEMFIQYSKDIIMSGEYDDSITSDTDNHIQRFFMCYHKNPRYYKLFMVDNDNAELYIIEQTVDRNNGDIYKYNFDNGKDYVKKIISKNERSVKIKYLEKNYILFSNVDNGEPFTNIFVLVNTLVLTQI